MKYNVFIFLSLCTTTSFTMQPAQWIRAADESLQREESFEKLVKTFHEASKILKKVQNEEGTRQLKKLLYKSYYFSENQGPELKAEIERLLNLGADPNITLENLRVGFPLHNTIETLSLVEIAILNYPELVELLLTHGAQPLGLHRAIKLGSQSLVRSLISHGADPNAQAPGAIWLDSSSLLVKPLPLIYSIFLKNAQMFELLIDLGADPNLKNSDGQSALDIITDFLNTQPPVRNRSIYQDMLKSATNRKRKLL